MLLKVPQRPLRQSFPEPHCKLSAQAPSDKATSRSEVSQRVLLLASVQQASLSGVRICGGVQLTTSLISRLDWLIKRCTKTAFPTVPLSRKNTPISRKMVTAAMLIILVLSSPAEEIRAAAFSTAGLEIAAVSGAAEP